MDEMVRSMTFVQVADGLNSYVVKNHPDSEKLKKEWIIDENPMTLRTGWNLTSIAVTKNPEVLNLQEILDTLETNISSTSPEAQWTINFTLAAIGINFPVYKERAISIGEKLGIYKIILFQKVVHLLLLQFGFMKW